MVRLPRNKKQTYRLISRPQMWPSGLTLAMTLNFQGQMRNWLYLCQTWSDCHKTKSKHINWTLGLKCDHQIWPWPWPWTWIFKVKYEICYISTKSGPIAMKQKANISIWPRGLKCDNGFDLGHDIDIWIFKVIWWPRSGIRIYQIVTGVTSDVGVPSTHLVLYAVLCRIVPCIKGIRLLLEQDHLRSEHELVIIPSFSVITIHPRPNLNGGLVNPFLYFGYGRLIISHCVVWM